MGKIFIIGLPRTGTTSLCAMLLDRGFKVAHTAYTIQSFEMADVIADTPTYCDYPFLDKYYSYSKFIYLERDARDWAMSMQALLTKTRQKIATKSRGYHPILERCFKQVFGVDSLDLTGLEKKYFSHRLEVICYFKNRPKSFLAIDISKNDAYSRICKFINIVDDRTPFPHLNEKGRVFEWKKIKHPLKIGSHERNNDRRQYFDITK